MRRLARAFLLTGACAALAGCVYWKKYPRSVEYFRPLGIEDPAYAAALRRIYVVLRTERPAGKAKLLEGAALPIPRHSSGVLREALFRAFDTPYSRVAAYQVSYTDEVPEHMPELKPSSSLWIRPSPIRVDRSKFKKKVTVTKNGKTKDEYKTITVLTARAEFRFELFAEPGHKPLWQGGFEAQNRSEYSSLVPDDADYAHIAAGGLLGQFAARLPAALHISKAWRWRWVHRGPKDVGLRAAWAAAKAKRWDEAAPLWEKGTRSVPEAWEPYWNLGVDREARSDWEGARRLYEEARSRVKKSRHRTEIDQALRQIDETLDPRAARPGWVPDSDYHLRTQMNYMADLHRKSPRKWRKGIKRLRKQSDWIRSWKDTPPEKKRAMIRYNDDLIALIEDFHTLSLVDVHAKTKELYRDYKKRLAGVDKSSVEARLKAAAASAKDLPEKIRRINAERTAWAPEPEPFKSAPLSSWFGGRWAVLPFDSEAMDLESYERPREAVRAWLEAARYKVIPSTGLDESLRDAGVTQGGQLNAFSPKELAAHTGARWLVYGKVHEFKQTNLGVYVHPKVEYSVRIVDGKTGMTAHSSTFQGGRKHLINPIDGAVLFVVGRVFSHVRKMKGTQLAAESFEAAEKHLETLPVVWKP